MLAHKATFAAMTTQAGGASEGRWTLAGLLA